MDAAHAFAIAQKIFKDDLMHHNSLTQEVDQIMKYACAAQLAAKFSTQEPRLATMVSEEWVRKALKTAEVLKYVNPEKYDEMFKTCMQTLLDSTPVDGHRQLVLISGYAGSMQASADMLCSSLWQSRGLSTYSTYHVGHHTHRRGPACSDFSLRRNAESQFPSPAHSRIGERSRRQNVGATCLVLPKPCSMHGSSRCVKHAKPSTLA